jgi:hypothetical protein
VDADAFPCARNLSHPVSTVAPSHFDAPLVVSDEHVLFEGLELLEQSRSVMTTGDGAASQ